MRYRLLKDLPDCKKGDVFGCRNGWIKTITKTGVEINYPIEAVKRNPDFFKPLPEDETQADKDWGDNSPLRFNYQDKTFEVEELERIAKEKHPVSIEELKEKARKCRETFDELYGIEELSTPPQPGKGEEV